MICRLDFYALSSSIFLSCLTCPSHFTFGIISEVNLFCYWLFTLSNLPFIASSKEPFGFLSSLFTVLYYIILHLFWSMNEPSLGSLCCSWRLEPRYPVMKHSIRLSTSHNGITSCCATFGSLWGRVSLCSCARSHRTAGVSAHEGWGRPGSGGCSGCSSFQVRCGGGVSGWAPPPPGPGVEAKPSTRKVSRFLWRSRGCGHSRQSQPVDMPRWVSPPRLKRIRRTHRAWEQN